MNYENISPMFARLAVCLILIGLSVQSNAQDIPEYRPNDPDLYAEIARLDSIYFQAYNTCDMETQRAMYADDIEFYHDRAGFAMDKEGILRAIEENICGKVKRYIVPGTLEVYPIPGHGAVAMGYHRFENAREPDAPSIPSRFVGVWKKVDDKWVMSRVISLH